MLLGRTPSAIPRPPPVAASFESPDLVRGSYGDPSDPVVISVVDGRLFRDGAEVYPILHGSYHEPGSGIVMRFRRGSDGRADALISLKPWTSGESVAPRVPTSH